MNTTSPHPPLPIPCKCRRRRTAPCSPCRWTSARAGAVANLTRIPPALESGRAVKWPRPFCKFTVRLRFPRGQLTARYASTLLRYVPLSSCTCLYKNTVKWDFHSKDAGQTERISAASLAPGWTPAGAVHSLHTVWLNTLLLFLLGNTFLG